MGDFATLGGNYGSTNEDRPIMSATEFQGCIDYVDIGVPPLRASKKGQVSKISRFLSLTVIISKTVADTAKVTIND